MHPLHFGPSAKLDRPSSIENSQSGRQAGRQAGNGHQTQSWMLGRAGQSYKLTGTILEPMPPSKA